MTKEAKMQKHRDPPLVLLLAGPSGGGKSTFLDCLRQCSLDPAIYLELPDGCEAWPICEANKIDAAPLDAGRLTTLAGHSPGIIVHYDIVDIRNYNDKSYDNDPRLAFLEEKVSTFLISIDPVREQLLEQYETRVQRIQTAKPVAKRLFAKLVKGPVKSVYRQLVKSKKATDRAELYRNSNALDSLIENWEAYIATHRNRAITNKSLRIAPATDSTFDAPKFTVLSKTRF